MTSGRFGNDLIDMAVKMKKGRASSPRSLTHGEGQDEQGDSVLSKIKGNKGSCVYIEIYTIVQAPLVDRDSVGT